MLFTGTDSLAGCRVRFWRPDASTTRRAAKAPHGKSRCAANLSPGRAALAGASCANMASPSTKSAVCSVSCSTRNTRMRLNSCDPRATNSGWESLPPMGTIRNSMIAIAAAHGTATSQERATLRGASPNPLAILRRNVVGEHDLEAIEERLRESRFHDLHSKRSAPLPARQVRNGPRSKFPVFVCLHRGNVGSTSVGSIGGLSNMLLLHALVTVYVLLVYVLLAALASRIATSGSRVPDE